MSAHGHRNDIAIALKSCFTRSYRSVSFAEFMKHFLCGVGGCM